MRSLGASDALIKQIFFFEGILITLTGALAGLFLGLVVCYAQQKFELVKLQAGGSFIISAYPVKMMLTDFIYVFLTIGTIGVAAAWLPVKRIGVMLHKPR